MILMENLKIEYVDINSIKPYENNAKEKLNKIMGTASSSC